MEESTVHVSTAIGSTVADVLAVQAKRIHAFFLNATDNYDRLIGGKEAAPPLEEVTFFAQRF